MRQIFIVAALLAVSGCATTQGIPTTAEPVDVRIIGFNDFHGALDPPKAATEFTNAAGDKIRVPSGGVAYLASAVDSLKAGQSNTVVVAAGDLIGASPLSSSLFLDEPSVIAMNMIGLEFNAVGNHEFDRGTEELLRCGGFSLVVLSGVEPDATETVRLSRAAREGGGAFVALTPHAAMASLRLTSSILPRGYDWEPSPFGEPAQVRRARILVHAHSLGWSAKTELVLPVSQHALRFALDSGIADRRGVLGGSKKKTTRQLAQR